MTTETTVAVDSNFKLLLMSRILVAVEKKWWHHVIIGIKHDCVCIVGVILPWSPGAARQHPREFDTNNTHTIMTDPLNTKHFGQLGLTVLNVQTRQKNIIYAFRMVYNCHRILPIHFLLSQIVTIQSWHQPASNHLHHLVRFYQYKKLWG